MVLDDEQLRELLLRKKEKIIQSYQNLRLQRNKLRKAYLKHFPKLTALEVKRVLQGSGGAIPIEQYREFIPLEKSFTSIEEMKKWAAQILNGKILVGVDGSQIYTSSDFNIPVGFVQAAAFWIKYGREGSQYDYDFLSQAYIGTEAIENKEGEPLNRMSIDQRRLSMEIELASKIIREHAGRGEKVFLMMDTPIVLRYLIWAEDSVKEAMCKNMVKLLDFCEETQTILLGYTDFSLARDITLTLKKMLGIEDEVKVSDISIVGPLLARGGFGSRTPAFKIQHNLLKDFYGRHSDKIGFFYQKVHSDLPVRVEFPLWVHSEGMIDEVSRVVAAQTVLGDGYPYVLLRAHEIAILDGEDRERFYDLVTWFLREECGMLFRETAKAERKRISVL